jgi:hypothetical protein
MLRFRPAGPVPGALALSLATALALPAMAQQAVPVPIPQTVAPTTPGSSTSSALSEARAREAAERILKVVQRRDATARFDQFAPSLQRVTSPAMIEATMKTQPELLSWKITGIEPGFDSSTVEATLVTSRGVRQLTMVINANGRLAGYHFDVTDAPAESVVRDFVTALSRGHYISASSFLSTSLQEEISQQSLQSKWQQLQRLTGNFVRIRKVSRAENTPEMKLVIVTTEFNRLTDNLFVTLDSRNQIIGVDFPTQPNPPAAVR